MARAALLLMATVILSRILGYGREVVLYSLIGQNYLTDAYRAAFSIPDLIYMLLVGGALSSALIPVISSYVADRNEEEGWVVFSIVSNWVILITIILLMAAYLFTRPLILLLTPGLPADYITLAVSLTHIMLLQTFFMALNGLALGLLNSYQHFKTPALGSLLYNLVIIIVGLLLYNQMGVAAFAYGVTIGALANFAVQIPALKKIGIRYHFTFDPTHPGFIQITRLMIPTLIGLGVVHFNFFVTQNIASHLGEGVLSSLNLAQRIMQLPVGIFAVSLGTALLPTLASLIARGEMTDFKRFASLGIRVTLLVSIPASLGLLAIGQPLISFLFEQGQFTPDMVGATRQVLVYYLPGLAAYSCLQVAHRNFYALKSTVVPVMAGVLAIGANVALSLFLAEVMGPSGLALAYSLAGWINLVLLLAALRIKIGHIEGGRIIISSMISLGASLIMFVVTAWLIRIIPALLPWTGKAEGMAALILAVIAGSIIYGAVIYPFKLPESEMFMQLVRRRFTAA